MSYPYGAGNYGAGNYGEGDLAAGLLVRTVGGDPLEVTVGSTVVPLSSVGSISLRHGRNRPDQPPDAGTATVTVRQDALPTLPTIGATLTVHTTDALASWTGAAPSSPARFVGRITDLAVSPDRAVAGPATVTLVAATVRAQLGRVTVGDLPWPQEDDAARAGRILALTGVPYTTDPGAVTVVARDVDRQPALSLLQELALHTGGLLAETRAGALAWHTQTHRTATTPAVSLTPSNVLRPATAEQSLGGLVNDLTLGYAGGAHRTSDETSVGAYGRYASSVSTQLASEADASSYAAGVLARRSRPRWTVPSLPVDLLRTADPALVAELLELEFADLVGLDGFPSAGPFSDARVWLEGWTETVTRDAWRLTLDVSNYRLTGPAFRWQQVDPALAWSDVDPALTWLDTLAGVPAAP